MRYTQAEVKGMGCLALVAIGAVIKSIQYLADNPHELAALLIGLLGLVVGGALFYRWHLQRQRDDAAARLAALSQRFGPETADFIMCGRIWQGQTHEMLVEALGPPADMNVSVLKTKTKHVYKYHPIAVNRYGLHVMLEDGAVIGWEEKG